MDVETTYRAFTSPFDFSYSGSTDSSSVYSSTSSSNGSGHGSGSRLLDQFSPDTLSSIWSATATSVVASLQDNSSKEANHEAAAAVFSGKDTVAVSCSPDVVAISHDGEKAGTGRESSSPPSGGGSLGASSVASSLETSALDNLTTASLFGDSVWSSKGSFNDLGSFGSTEEERRFLAEGAGKGYLKPPGSAPGSNSSATWGSFWSDLSPSLSPSNSETNLQHFGSSPSTLGNPFAAWSASTAQRRVGPVNSSSSPFSSGSVSPISRKPLSPNMSLPAGPTPAQSVYNNHNQRGGFPPQQNGHYNSAVRHQQYRRSASHPNNGHLLHHHNHQANHQYYNNGMNNGFDQGNFYPSSQQQSTATSESVFSGGWNMEPATSINGYHQQENRNYASPGGTTMNGMDNMKYGFDSHIGDLMRENAWDDHGKGKNFFGSYASYDGSRNNYSDSLLDPFDQMVPASISPLASRMSPRNQSSSSEFGNDHMHVFSRKVFVGGLPPDIDEEEITTSFRRFGPLIVDWPHKAESKSYFPPKGYAFLLFQDESSVQTLMDASVQEGDKTYFYVSSPTNKDKPVQVRPWRLTDNECYLDAQSKLDPRLTVFVGGVPRPLRAQELAVLMNQRFGYVAYAGIDVDSELKYPKGAGRITFSNQQSYIAAINARFVQLQNGEIDKRVELKPYVLDDQICDYCHGMKCSGRSAPLFCSQVGCLAYLCEHCWTPYHNSPGKEHHKPVTKESSVDRSRPAAMRW